MPLVVDHDHACCPGAHSCGLCVRAFLCNRCNLVTGLVSEDPVVIAGILEYVQSVHKMT